MRQLPIAIDECFNCCTWARTDVEGEDWLSGFGKADETLSARAWRLQFSSSNWQWFHEFVNLIFFLQKDQHGNRNHCERSFKRELERKHLPKAYQVGST